MVASVCVALVRARAGNEQKAAASVFCRLTAALSACREKKKLQSAAPLAVNTLERHRVHSCSTKNKREIIYFDRSARMQTDDELQKQNN